MKRLKQYTDLAFFDIMNGGLLRSQQQIEEIVYRSIPPELQRQVISSFERSVKNFHREVSLRRFMNDRNIGGVVVILPGEGIDEMTGEPTPELVEKVRERMGEIYQKEESH